MILNTCIPKQIVIIKHLKRIMSKEFKMQFKPEEYKW